MRFAVLSDIHGNLPALEAVLEDIRSSAVDEYIVAGDFVRFPHANETIEIIRSLKSWIIQGNADTSLLSYAGGDAPPEWKTLRQFGLLRWCFQNLMPGHLNYLGSLPEQLVIRLPGVPAIRVVHGAPWDPNGWLAPDSKPGTIQRALDAIREPVLICGHTHRSWDHRQDGRLVLNPGAVCGGLNGDPRAQYALLDWVGDGWEVTFRVVAYDNERLRQAFICSGLLEEGGALARAFLLSSETGIDVGRDFFNHANRIADEAGVGDLDFIPDEVWEQADCSFTWDQYKQSRIV
jgi:putative phosphoesterase